MIYKLYRVVEITISAIVVKRKLGNFLYSKINCFVQTERTY